MSDKVVVTCALNGVLTNPKHHPVPVTPEEMADSAKEAYDAGAAVMHIHFRRQEEGMGHFPSWQPEVAKEISDAIRDKCPGVLLNFTTGVPGDDISGPLGCLEACEPEMAAMNSGSLNYLKLRSNGEWAWPPMLFDNPVSKIEKYLDKMYELGITPECECFDTGIVRSVKMFADKGMLKMPAMVSLVMGVASGMPARNDLLPILIDEVPDGAHWQTIVIGRDEVWDVHRRSAELGGNLRTGVEDTFYLPNGEKTSGNGELIEELVKIARECGREPMSPEEVRSLLQETGS
jgi:uncharacterized protein (DUF849 family)